VERIARELAAAKRKYMMETILDALRHLKAESKQEGERKKTVLRAIAKSCTVVSNLDQRQAEGILGYDDDGAYAERPKRGL
jgi:hypothetical protein